jgi:tRNA-specific 2-thiouridylase
LRRREPGLAERLEGGAFVRADTGETVGRHAGYPFYTVGQRRGLGLSAAEPLYVTRIDAATNTVYVGPHAALLGRTLTAGEIVWGKRDGLGGAEARVQARIRYKDPGAPALARETEGGGLEVVFETPRAAITPGQAVVLYDDDDVLAGGWIRPAAAAPVKDASLYLSLPVR